MTNHMQKLNETISKQAKTIEILENTLKEQREQTHKHLQLIMTNTQNLKEEQEIQQITNNSITSLIAKCIYDTKTLNKANQIEKQCKISQTKLTKEIKDKIEQQRKITNIENIPEPNIQNKEPPITITESPILNNDEIDKKPADKIKNKNV